jgi:hypothetical protein
MTRTRSKIGKRSRRKGHQWERDLVNLFRRAMPGAQCKRHPQYTGADEPDVTAGPFDVSGKCGKKPPVRAALAELGPRPARWRVAAIKEDHRPPFVVVPLDEFLDLVSEWWMYKRESEMVGDGESD